uniref:WD repeat-containing protein 60 n=1 Tax=Trichuris muris TaxID=70415 RepID=A0A5S6QMQ0_TRIMR
MSVEQEKTHHGSTKSKNSTIRKQSSRSEDSSAHRKDAQKASNQARFRQKFISPPPDAKQTKQQNGKKKAVPKVEHIGGATLPVVGSKLPLNEKSSSSVTSRRGGERKVTKVNTTVLERMPDASRQSLSAAYLNPALLRNVRKISIRDPKKDSRAQDQSSTYGKPSVPVALFPMATGKDEHSEESFEDDFEEYEEEEGEENEVEEEEEEEEKEGGKAETEKDKGSVSTAEKQELLTASYTELPGHEQKALVIDNETMDWSGRLGQEKAMTMPNIPESLPTIDFSKTECSEERWLALQRLEERSLALKPYVQLDCEFYSLCSIPPSDGETTFWYYSRAVGIEHKCLQTRDDNVDKETEPIAPLLEDKQTQHPMMRNFSCTGDIESAGQVSAFDSMEQRQRCRIFVNHASSLLTRLIRSRPSMTVPKLGHSTQPFSKGTVSFNLGLLGRRCTVTCLSLSSFAGKCRCLVAYSIEESALEYLEQKGLLAIWGFHDFDKPQKLLLCEAVPTCCLLHEDGAWALAACGMADGTVALWDLGEPDCWHRTVPWRISDVSLRRATYDTAFFCGDEKDLCSKVVQILPLNVQRSPTGESDALQLASLNENGQIIIWSVVEVVPAGRPLEKDGLLRPIGRVKLLKSNVIRSATTSYALNAKPSIAFCLAYSGNEFFVGSSGGNVFKVSRHQDERKPTGYGINSETSEVLCMEFSPDDNDIYLAGMSSGRILVFSKTERKPLAIIKMANEYAHLSVKCAQWSRINPLTFYSLHSPNVFAVWNLEEGTWRMQCFVLEKSAVAMSFPKECSTKRKDRRHAQSFLVLGYADGSAEVHAIEEKFPSEAAGQTMAEIIKRNVNDYFLVA